MDISVSILGADFLNLENNINLLSDFQIDSLHVDIMDGCFVENSSWGTQTVKDIKKITNIPLDIHLMMNKPEKKLKEYLDIKPRSIYIHPESTNFVRKNLLDIKKHGIRAGLAFKLETPVDIIENCIDILDGVLLLSSDEGFGGNSFNDLALSKIEKIHQFNKDSKLLEIIIDGGINEKTSKKVALHGATKVVSGSYVLKDKNKIEEKINNLK